MEALSSGESTRDGGHLQLNREWQNIQEPNEWKTIASNLCFDGI